MQKRNPGSATPRTPVTSKFDRRVLCDTRPGFSVNEMFSARGTLAAWQTVFILVLLAALIAGLFFEPVVTLSICAAALAIPFFCVILLRSGALWLLVTTRQGSRTGVPALPDDALPSYSILVPLYDEVEILPDLLRALTALDYPENKLDIQWIVESCDHATQAALQNLKLPRHIRITIVPDTIPRTKPKAVNYALGSVSGDVVVIYDAEDMPEPDQLRLAAAALTADETLGCVQARLNVYNRQQSFLTRQFTIEYTALFDCLLPMLSRLGFPVPLGGTSNHFPKDVLFALGGWDSYNVTEDADLGICLARAGYRVAVLNSTTWEEAPAELAVWMRQRTRWLKGWLQTYLVHMREPARCHGQLGGWAFLGMQVFTAGVLLSVLVHPWFYVLAAVEFMGGTGAMFGWAGGAGVLWWLAVFNLVAGYLAGILLGFAATWTRGWKRLSLWSVAMPVYWILISCAAYRALWQSFRAPYLWEKTKHRPRRDDESGALNRVG